MRHQREALSAVLLRALRVPSPLASGEGPGLQPSPIILISLRVKGMGGGRRNRQPSLPAEFRDSLAWLLRGRTPIRGYGTSARRSRAEWRWP
jgi:hypothetical protein